MTRFNNKYPYTDFHELNADWLLETVKDAAAEAQEASDTVATYNDRLTTVEGDLAPIKAAMPGLASDVSDLQHDVGIMDSLITNTINPGLSTLQGEVETPSTGLLDRMTAAEGSISTLQNEVETPSTGLLDRVTALENQPPATANAVYYLEFDSSLVSIDPDNAYDSRIEYDWLKQFVPLNISGEDTHVIKLYDSHTQKVYDLAGFHLQESVSPDGIFVFTNRAEHVTGGVVDYYVNSTVIVSQNASNPAFSEVTEDIYTDDYQTITLVPSIAANVISRQATFKTAHTCHLEFVIPTNTPLGAGNGILDTTLPAPVDGALDFLVFDSTTKTAYAVNITAAGALVAGEYIGGASLYFCTDYAI